MISAPLSATDTFTPALDRMKRLLFKPFRFGVWWRLAFLALFTGELSSSGFNFNFPGNFSSPSRNKSSNAFAATPPFHWPSVPHLIAWIALAALVFVVVMLVFMYVSSILRFVLFDAVLSGNVRIREGWRRWKQRGATLFPWQIGFTLVMFAIYAILFGVPILLAWRAGIFRNPGAHIALLILGGLALFGLAVVIILAGLAVYVLTKDFVVPIMAFEGVGPIAGWRRLKLMLSGNKGSYAGYLGFKAVLSIAAAIVQGIATIILFVVVLIPCVLIAVFLGILLPGAGAGLSAVTITLLVIGGVIVVLLLLSITSLLAVPFVVFFQSYALHFFGSRYEPLRAVMYPPPPPQAPPAPPMDFSPQPAM
jgi:hypothetical protein